MAPMRTVDAAVDVLDKWLRTMESTMVVVEEAGAPDKTAMNVEPTILSGEAMDALKRTTRTLVQPANAANAVLDVPIKILIGEALDALKMTTKTTVHPRNAANAVVDVPIKITTKLEKVAGAAHR